MAAFIPACMARPLCVQRSLVSKPVFTNSWYFPVIWKKKYSPRLQKWPKQASKTSQRVAGQHVGLVNLFLVFLCKHVSNVLTEHFNDCLCATVCVCPDTSVRSGKTVLMVAAFLGLRSLCPAINKSPWITGEAGSQYSCVRVWAGQWNDWSSGGLSARKNAVWWDCRLGGREGKGTGADSTEGNKRHTSISPWLRGKSPNLRRKKKWFMFTCNDFFCLFDAFNKRRAVCNNKKLIFSQFG